MDVPNLSREQLEVHAAISALISACDKYAVNLVVVVMTEPSQRVQLIANVPPEASDAILKSMTPSGPVQHIVRGQG